MKTFLFSRGIARRWDESRNRRGLEARRGTNDEDISISYCWQRQEKKQKSDDFIRNVPPRTPGGSGQVMNDAQKTHLLFTPSFLSNNTLPSRELKALDLTEIPRQYLSLKHDN